MTEPNTGGTGAGNAYNQIAIHEYSGLALASPLDVSAAATGTTPSSPFTISSGSANTATNGELIFGYANALSTVPSAGIGFTVRQTTVGVSEDLVQTSAGAIAATESITGASVPYVMLMSAFIPAFGGTSGPVFPLQVKQSAVPLATLTVTNTAVELNTNAVTTSTTLFNYTNRAALLADGWSFIATNAGGARNTELTNPALQAVSYDQTAHPGTLRIPCTMGDMLGAANNTTNSLFRNLSSNWVSMRLSLAFAPVANYQQAALMLYQDDDNYVEVEFGYFGVWSGNYGRHGPSWKIHVHHSHQCTRHSGYLVADKRADDGHRAWGDQAQSQGDSKLLIGEPTKLIDYGILYEGKHGVAAAKDQRSYPKESTAHLHQLRPQADQKQIKGQYQEQPDD